MCLFQVPRPPRILYCGDGSDDEARESNKVKRKPVSKIQYVTGDVTSPKPSVPKENMVCNEQ